MAVESRIHALEVVRREDHDECGGQQNACRDPHRADEPQKGQCGQEQRDGNECPSRIRKCNPGEDQCGDHLRHKACAGSLRSIGEEDGPRQCHEKNLREPIGISYRSGGAVRRPDWSVRLDADVELLIARCPCLRGSNLMPQLPLRQAPKLGAVIASYLLVQAQ
jgi:hypothetical protein